MKKKFKDEKADEPREEFDFRQHFKGGVQRKQEYDFCEGVYFVLLEQDVAGAFPTGKAINEALRMVIQLGKLSKSASKRRSKKMDSQA